MSANDDEVLIGLILPDRQRILRSTVEAVRTPAAGPGQTMPAPVPGHLVTANNLPQSLTQDRRRADPSSAQTESGPAPLTRPASTPARTQQAAAHPAAVTTLPGTRPSSPRRGR
ncbi:hypothetical protein [Streptomyces acidiscabies]|uniref:Uncharacterized protein n=1 Tax=Streptomyces acidiscabies TaxID=42234 RepID=A0AAP6BJ37_9ACTN|nr:hypothetical protein [Streptomyces acidiscabies]MBP5935423.1 hypothetical protein [Streptomyces sp. LBUM 1476]MBZ3916722.1 hypothetical protein [Streptomyces acidiscabies]MDX2965641.1 hypothetical protein [Streptomyces acidiscabies]MDX3024857.1 hypothetical protein [Streptomyces acidiscabies]MDX3795557.1 hypothetical protein [Streptomyces acidiscabies]